MPVAETLHITHTLRELVRSVVVGSPRNDCVSTPLLSIQNPDGVPRAQWFLRIEFQDGTKKLPTQEYHGSGRVHLHALIWVDDAEWSKCGLEQAACATMPSTDELRGVAAGSQLGRDTSKLPVFSESSRWNEDKKCFQLLHTSEDKNKA